MEEETIRFHHQRDVNMTALGTASCPGLPCDLLFHPCALIKAGLFLHEDESFIHLKYYSSHMVERLSARRSDLFLLIYFQKFHPTYFTKET